MQHKISVFDLMILPWGKVDVDIMINYLALQGESYQNMLRILQKNGYFHCNILQ